MKIGILGGTFNPLHNGHIEISKYVKEHLNLDEVWIIPTFKTPFKKFVINSDNPKLRYKIVKKTINKSDYGDWLIVKDFEQKIKGTSYTFKTIKYIKKKYPNNDYYFILGDDHWNKINDWKKIDYIKDNVKMVFVRHSDEIKKNISNHEEYIYLNEKYIDLSSSSILINADWKSIPEKSKPYIAINYLYIKELIYYHLNSFDGKKSKNGKYIHSLSTANHAKKLAKTYKYDNVKKAYYAGLAHDLFKNHPIDKQIKYIKEASNWKLPPEAAMHGYYCALWFEKEYLINDQEFISAIKKHTIASDNMSKLDKIIFVADKIAGDRKDAVSKKYRKLAYKDLDITFYKLLLELETKLKSQKINLDPETEKALKKHKV